MGTQYGQDARAGALVVVDMGVGMYKVVVVGLGVLGLLDGGVVQQRGPVQALGVDERTRVLLLRKLQVL